MQPHRLRHCDHTTLFSGDYRTLQDCIEDALRMNVCLDGINLDRRDLRDINLDGARIKGASFNGANLSGANISEASLRDCLFRDTSLFNACFCHTDLSGSDFTQAGFGGTDMSAATLDHCTFSGPAALGLNLQHSASLTGAVYASSRLRSTMSRAPVVIAGLPDIIALFDDDVLIGQNVYTGMHTLPREHQSLVLQALTAQSKSTKS